MNIVDVAIILFLAYSLYDGWRRGLLALIADLVALAISILAALEMYPAFSPLISRLFRVQEHAGKVMTFFIVAFALGSLLSYVFGLALRLIPSAIRGSQPDKVSGAAVGLLRGFVYLGIVLLLLTSLPVLQPVKDTVAGSSFAPPLTSRAKVIAAKTEGFLKSKFGGLVDDTFALLTVKPGEGGVDLGFKVSKFRVDDAAEEEMLQRVNEERRNRGLAPLTMDRSVREAARAHSTDMFQRGYFSHQTPEGKTPADRLDDRGIEYTVMGENLALAPDVELAHRGLMNSPTHRDNILFSEYRKIGIGAINGGIYGIMFSQEFTD